MTYQVLARKYRPQKFSEVIGQEHVTQTLVNALSAGRLHHAYLFTGARGVGKTTVARVLAKALNCVDRKECEPCGKCGPCAEITGGSSLDVQEIDGASNTGVDDVRELRERTKYMPSSGKYKIYIIDEVHMLSTSAFNALLKTLEEPPAHVVFIFATTEAQKIPATILSRCQRYDFRRIPQQAIAATLKRIARDEGVAADDEALHMIAREATGSLRDAESLFDQAIAFSGGAVTSETIKLMLGFLDRKLLFDAIDAVIARDAKAALAVLDGAFESGTDLVRFSMDVLELIRHMLVISECGEGRGAVDLLPEEIGFLKKAVARSSAPELHQMFSIWYRIAEDVARSPFPKMLLDVGLVRLCRVGDIKSIEDLLAKVEGALGDAPFTVRQATPTNASATTPAASPKQTVQKADLPVIVKHPAPKPEAHSPAPVSAPALAHSPTFEPVASQADADSEKKWQEFMRWLVGERPQVAAIIQHGVLVGIDEGVVKMMFDNPLYAGMLTEDARKQQVEGMFETFFKRKMRLAVGASDGGPAAGTRGERKREAMREALGNDIVRQAADILNAQIYDVKVDEKK